MARAAALIACALLIGAALSLERGQATPAASRIIDRTVVCRTVGVGYPDAVRFMNVSAEPFQHLGGAPAAPWLSISNAGPGGESGVGAGIRTGPWGNDASGFVSLSRTRCKTTSVRVPLSSAGLRGGPTQHFG